MPPNQIQIEERFINVENCRVRYLTGGSGPVLLFIHGLFGYSFSWRFNLPVLAESHTIYALDLPGAGFSERIAGKDCSMPALSASVIAFMQAVGISEAALIGSSHGGSVAVSAAAMAQGLGIKLKALVLVSPANPWSPSGRMRLRLGGTRIGAALFRALSPCILPFNDFFLRRMYGDVQRMAPGTCDGYAKVIALPGTVDQLLGRVRHWHHDMQNLAELLPRISHLPVLLIWGGRDRAVDPNSAHSLKRMLPGAKLVIFPEAGHLPYEERPDEFNQALVDFLQQIH